MAFQAEMHFSLKLVHFKRTLINTKFTQKYITMQHNVSKDFYIYERVGLRKIYVLWTLIYGEYVLRCFENLFDIRKFWMMQHYLALWKLISCKMNLIYIWYILSNIGISILMVNIPSLYSLAIDNFAFIWVNNPFFEYVMTIQIYS